MVKKLATVPFSISEKYKLSASIRFLLNKMCSVDQSGRMMREEFMELNLKNFTTLNHFNDPHLVMKKDESKRSTANQSPANRIKRSKSKNSKPVSKEKIKEKEYRLGRRKKSTEKPEPRSKRSA